MKIELSIYRTGDCNRYWTYCIAVDGELINTKPLIYRMYKKESTAIRNGQRFMDAVLYKYIKKTNIELNYKP